MATIILESDPGELAHWMKSTLGYDYESDRMVRFLRRRLTRIDHLMGTDTHSKWSISVDENTVILEHSGILSRYDILLITGIVEVWGLPFKGDFQWQRTD